MVGPWVPGKDISKTAGSTCSPRTGPRSVPCRHGRVPDDAGAVGHAVSLGAACAFGPITPACDLIPPTSHAPPPNLREMTRIVPSENW